MPSITKNQIRPRRIKARFSNDEILLLDTTSFIQLIPPAPDGFALSINFVQYRTNIISAYTNIDANCSMFLFDDFTINAVQIDETALGAVSALFNPSFGGTVGLNALSASEMYVNAFNDTVANPGASWTDLAEISNIGGLFFVLTNGGSGDLTGGDPLNFMDIFIDYSIVNF